MAKKREKQRRGTKIGKQNERKGESSNNGTKVSSGEKGTKMRGNEERASEMERRARREQGQNGP